MEFVKAPVSVIAETIAGLLGVGVVVQPEPGKVEVPFVASDEPGETALRRLAALCGMVAVMDGGVVMFVEKKAGVEAVVVFRSEYLEPKDIVEMLKVVAGTDVGVAVVGDRVVLAGSVAAAERAEAIRPFLEAGPDGWALEVRLVRVTRSLSDKLGIEWGVSGGVVLNAGGSSGGVVAPIVGSRASAVVSMLAEAARSTSDAELVYTAPLLVLEGRKSVLHNGETVPIPKKTVSAEGTVTTTGYDATKVGFSLDVEAKRVNGGVMLTLKPELSAITGFVGDIPIVSASAVESSAVIKNGDWVVLGGLASLERTVGVTGGPGFLSPPLFGQTTGRWADSRLLFLVQARRVFASGAAVRP